MPRGVGALPLATLLVVAAAAMVAKLGGFGGKPRAPAPPASAASASSVSIVSKQPTPGLAGPPAPPEARVAEHAARMIHGDVRHTHRAHGKIPHAATPAWEYATAGGIAAQVTTSPDEQTLYVASLDGQLAAIARADGKKKWSASLGDRVYSTPLVADDGTVYVGSDAHAFFAITPEGKTKWRLETDGDADTGAATTKEGLVVFAAGNVVYAARPSGDVAWRFKTKKKVYTSPAIADDGKIVFGAQDDKVYALEPNGKLAWSTDVGGDVDGSPAIGDDGTIVVGTDAGEVVRLSPAGEVVSRAKVGGYVRGALAIARDGDALAGVFGPEPRQVRVAPDGTVRGAMTVPGTGAVDFGVLGGALEDDDGALLFGGQDDGLYAVEAGGALRWRFAAPGDVDAPATLLSNGDLVVACDVGDGEGGKVYLFTP